MTRLSERAMLTSLHISSYAGNMFDQQATEEFNESNNADRKRAGRYNKKLIDPKFLSGVSAAHNNARRLHRLLTLPWDDDGTRILTTAGYLPYTEKMHDCRLKAEDEVKQFISTLPDAVKEAKQRLGELFNEDDYPTNDVLKSKFGFDVEIKPVPESGDFRAQLSDAQVKAIVKDIERRADQRLEKAVDDIFNRVKEAVAHLSDRLKAYVPAKIGEKAQGRIHDTTVYNIHELAEMLPILNITNDPRIDQLRQQLTDELVEHSPEILRADTKIRQQTISKADAILKKVQKYMK